VDENEIIRIRKVLDHAQNGKISALAEGDRVLIMIQNAPEELRKLADAMERIGVSEMRAFVAYAAPEVREVPGKVRAEPSEPEEES